jgi:nucleoside 2-deoxyribosyltransferase
MRNRLSCFVIMPFSPAADRIFRNAILPALDRVDAADILPLRADTMGSVEITLPARVTAAIEAADFCIVDVSGSNPNVMFELGFATATRKPVVLISRVADERAPTNIASLKLLTYDPERLEEFAAALAETVSNIVESTDRSNRLITTSAFSVDLLEETHALAWLAQSSEFTLSALVGSPRLLAERILPLARDEAGERSLVVRIVCADPEGEFARIRAVDSGRPIHEYRQDLWRALHHLEATVRDRPHMRVELRLTQRILGTSIYLSDSVALVLPYLLAGVSRETAGIVLMKEWEFRGFSLFQHQFGKVWEESVGASFRDLPFGRRSIE